MKPNRGRQIKALVTLALNLAFYPLCIAAMIWALITQQPWYVPVGIMALFLMVEPMWKVLAREFWCKLRRRF